MLLSDLSIIVRGSSIFLNRSLAGYELNAGEQIILMYLFSHEKTNQEAVANYFMLDKGSVARTLQKLEEKKLITRLVNDENQREKIIMLTNKASEVKSICDLLLSDWNHVMYEGISMDELYVFKKVSFKMAENIAQHLSE